MVTQVTVLRTDEPTQPNVVYRYHLDKVPHVVRGNTRDAEAAIDRHLQSIPGGPYRAVYRDAPHLDYIVPSWDTDIIGR